MNQKNQWTLKLLLDDTIQKFQHVGIEQPEVDAKWMLMNYFDYSTVDYILNQNKVLDPLMVENFGKEVQRRLNREPLQYIHGYQQFRSLDFAVDPSVLIPRPETEMLIDLIIDHEEKEQAKILDIGTGTGCIAISLLWERKHWEGIALDISVDALDMAKKNVKTHEMEKRLQCIHSDLFSGLGEAHYKSFDVIVSNPPYIPDEDLHSLEPEVAQYEPHSALFGGEDGLDFYRRITKESPAYLKEGGQLFYEIGIHQSEAIVNMMEEEGFSHISVVNDLTGIPRFVYGTYQQ